MGLFLITSPSGVGKTTVMNYIKDNLNISIGECVSDTTRNKRVGEVDGVTYYYRSVEEFENMSKNGDFAEEVEYHGNRYAVSKKEIDIVLSEYEHAYIIVEFNGYQQIKDIYPDAIGIFLKNTKDVAMANMIKRGDKVDDVLKRINTYEEEIKNSIHFDYVITNVMGKLEQTASIIENIVEVIELHSV